MIGAFTGLLLCQLVGEILARALRLPLPGPVLGLLLLFGLLAWRGQTGRAVPAALDDVANGLLRNLSLLFIPAAVGVVQYLGLLRQLAVPIALAVVVSTALALAVTALTFAWLSRDRAPPDAAAPDSDARP